MRRRNVVWTARVQVLPALLLAAAVLLFFAAALSRLDSGRSAEDRRQLEESLRRGCLVCYAAEGRYPPNLEHLREYCGIQIDETRYTVYYSAFAENLMPDITVLENTP